MLELGLKLTSLNSSPGLISENFRIKIHFSLTGMILYFSLGECLIFYYIFHCSFWRNLYQRRKNIEIHEDPGIFSYGKRNPHTFLHIKEKSTCCRKGNWGGSQVALSQTLIHFNFCFSIFTSFHLCVIFLLSEEEKHNPIPSVNRVIRDLINDLWFWTFVKEKIKLCKMYVKKENQTNNIKLK